jgi:hypothetical protein
VGDLRVGDRCAAAGHDQHGYRPTHAQAHRLASDGLQPRWIEPDGRGVFGALGHLLRMSAADVIGVVLRGLERLRPEDPLHENIRTMGTNEAPLSIAALSAAIRTNNWVSHLGDLILQVAATIPLSWDNCVWLRVEIGRANAPGNGR